MTRDPYWWVYNARLITRDQGEMTVKARLCPLSDTSDPNDVHARMMKDLTPFTDRDWRLADWSVTSERVY